MDKLIIGNKTFQSRLFIGTGKYDSNITMERAVSASGTEMVTVALKRVHFNSGANTEEKMKENLAHQDDLLKHLTHANLHILPNTSGVRKSKEAVFAAQLAREALETNWIKLEIHPDPKYLLPDPVETLDAAEKLANLGFIVLPYCHADAVLCKRLEDAGAAAVMPLASPIGSNNGLQMQSMIRIIIEQSNVPVIIDAGIGAPSHAAAAMEMGADAVLVNTAIALADNPVLMAEAFKQAVEAGRKAHTAKLCNPTATADMSSPLTAFLDESS